MLSRHLSCFCRGIFNYFMASSVLISHSFLQPFVLRRTRFFIHLSVCLCFFTSLSFLYQTLVSFLATLFGPATRFWTSRSFLHQSLAFLPQLTCRPITLIPMRQSSVSTYFQLQWLDSCVLGAFIPLVFHLHSLLASPPRSLPGNISNTVLHYSLFLEEDLDVGFPNL